MSRAAHPEILPVPPAPGPGPHLSAIVPVHNGTATLPACLAALAAGTRPPDEILVADDASTDGSREVALEMGARVVALEPGPAGPAAARNHGAAAAAGEVLLYVDADVVVHPDAVARLLGCLNREPAAAAAFGSYDDAPPAPGLVSRAKNLTHHYVHQHARENASTFWAGFGCVRREAFEAAGGFDESYRRPSIEDIALGVRLREGGFTIRCCPAAQAAHLKRWTLASLWRTDIRDRALPWSELIVRRSGLPDDLNTGRASRWSAALAWTAVLLGLAGVAFPPAWLGAAAAAGSVAALNRDLYRFYAAHGGWGFAAGAAALHGAYLLYSSAVFGIVAARSVVARSPGPRSSGPRSSVPREKLRG